MGDSQINALKYIFFSIHVKQEFDSLSRNTCCNRKNKFLTCENVFQHAKKEPEDQTVCGLFGQNSFLEKSLR